MAGEPMLSQSGSNDPEWVAHLQRALIDQGYDPGPVDGVFGPKTNAAVRQYQLDHGLAVDGIVGPMTWASLNGEEAPVGGGGGGGAGGTAASSGGSTATNGQAADCGIFGFNGSSINFTITNTGPESWQAGDVAYDCIVMRAGVLVQQENQAIVGLQPGSNFFRDVPFLGGHVHGDYVAALTVIDLHTNGTLASDVSEFSNPMVPESGGY